MVGVVTRHAEELTWPEFDRGFYEVKGVSGRQVEPVETGVNMVACHGDTAASRDAALVPIDDAGRPATRERKYFDWGFVCPTDEAYRSGLLELIERCSATNDDVRIDDVGFPRPEYCHCERCSTAFRASEADDRIDWRKRIVTEFVTDVRDRVPGRLYLTVYPDPYPGHLATRTGLDLAEVEGLVDEVVVPIYDMAYSTTYWLEILASGFRDALSTPFSVELYAVGVDVDNLAHAATVADAYASDVYFGYDAANARATIRRMDADDRAGAAHGDAA